MPDVETAIPSPDVLRAPRLSIEARARDSSQQDMQRTSGLFLGELDAARDEAALTGRMFRRP